MFWLGAIVSLCYVPGYTGAYISTQWPVLALVLPFALLRDGPVTVFHWFGIAFITYAAALAPLTMAPYASVFGLWLLATTALCVWFGTVSGSLRDLYKGLAVGATVSSFISVLQYFGMPVLPSTSLTPAGLYVNAVQNGTILALVIVALVSERLWLWTLPLWPGEVVAHSRGAWIALAIGLLGCRYRKPWLFGLVVLAGAVFMLSPLNSSDAQRLYIWKTALYNTTPFGWGPGMFYVLLMNDGHGPFYPEHAHNDAIQLAFEYGFAALLPLSVLCFAVSRAKTKEWPVVLAFMVAGCYSMPLWMPVTSFLGLACVGRILRDYGLARSQRSRGGPFVLQRLFAGGCEAVSVASHHTGKS